MLEFGIVGGILIAFGALLAIASDRAGVEAIAALIGGLALVLIALIVGFAS